MFASLAIVGALSLGEDVESSTGVLFPATSCTAGLTGASANLDCAQPIVVHRPKQTSTTIELAHQADDQRGC